MTHITNAPNPPDPPDLAPDFEGPDEPLPRRPPPVSGPPGFLFAVFGFVGGSVLLAAILLFLGPLFGVMIALVVFVFYGWMLFAFLNYRHGRQEELLQLLATAVQANAPLAPALRAYLSDRPSRALHEVWMATLLFFVLPGYYWLWHRRHNFDAKVALVARMLERGVALDAALRATPGVLPREAVLAVAIGQSTGELAVCLRNSSRNRMTTAWLELLPDVLYPLGLLLFITGITTFWMIAIAPRIQRIFQEFGQKLPGPTAALINGWQTLWSQDWLLVLLFMLLIATVVGLLFSPMVRWHFPGLSRLYRRSVQSRLMQMLAVLLKAGKTMPEALEVLADSGYFANVVTRRLDIARHRVAQGEPWVESLFGEGLLPQNVVPMLKAAERVGNLPWALTELGDAMTSRSLRVLRRLTLLISPAVICIVGLLVAFIVVGMFIPLVELMTELSSGDIPKFRR